MWRTRLSDKFDFLHEQTGQMFSFFPFAEVVAADQLHEALLHWQAHGALSDEVGSLLVELVHEQDGSLEPTTTFALNSRKTNMFVTANHVLWSGLKFQTAWGLLYPVLGDSRHPDFTILLISDLSEPDVARYVQALERDNDNWKSDTRVALLSCSLTAFLQLHPQWRRDAPVLVDDAGSLRELAQAAEREIARRPPDTFLDFLELCAEPRFRNAQLLVFDDIYHERKFWREAAPEAQVRL